jgi:hypothetical protein
VRGDLVTWIRSMLGSLGNDSVVGHLNHALTLLQHPRPRGSRERLPP